MRGGRWGLLAVVMVMMMAALCGQTMRGQAMQPRAETEVGDGSALRTDTPGPHGRARVPIPTRALVPPHVLVPTPIPSPHQ